MFVRTEARVVTFAVTAATKSKRLVGKKKKDRKSEQNSLWGSAKRRATLQTCYQDSIKGRVLNPVLHPGHNPARMLLLPGSCC